MVTAQALRRIRLRLCAYRAQGTRLAVERRRAVRRVLRLPGKPPALALHRRNAGREAIDGRGVTAAVSPVHSGREVMAAPNIEDRLRAIEDRLEIYNLIASHPPSADTGADYFTRAAYT